MRKFCTKIPNYSSKQLELKNMINNVRNWGYINAIDGLNPLSQSRGDDSRSTGNKHINEISKILSVNEELELKGILKLADSSGNTLQKATPAQVFDQLEDFYMKTFAVECGFISDEHEREWIFNSVEDKTFNYSSSFEKNAYVKMKMANLFEQFLAKKMTAFKRYSGEGAESMMVMIDYLIQLAGKHSIDEVVIGMPHRGRLALLVSVLDYPVDKMMSKIYGKTEFPAEYDAVDDVTSHITTSIDKSIGDQNVHVTLLPNPSHLEIINTVANGKVRAKMEDGNSAISILMHGDAAFSGQGCVPEGFALSKLPDYQAHGTVHIVVNNQIGFTTTMENGRSSRHCTDIAKTVEAPIIHVNAESIPDVLKACKIAMAYREKFKKDIVIDLVGYRKYGHNEVDEPSFTQPHMYEKIRARKAFPDEYGESLLERGVITSAKMRELQNKLEKHLENAFKVGKNYKVDGINAFQGKWSNMKFPSKTEMHNSISNSGVDKSTLLEIGLQSVSIPDDFNVHERLQRTHIQARQKALKNEKDIQIDWATAESMAFGSLLLEGHNIRLAGQDCRRGTFSQRHATLVDQKDESHYTPLDHLAHKKGRFQVINSNLSELAVMAYEYGYSWENPKNLVLWEAQFGDFNNGAQIVIDQFIASGESKWMRQSGLVLLLPHGYDGAGPDHSSAKLERFLQMVDSPGFAPPTPHQTDFSHLHANINFGILYPTTPANFFHALRRQQLRNFRKPLIIMAPKTLLRLPEATSPISAMTKDTHFESILLDQPKHQVSRILLCTGKIYYELSKRRTKSNDTTTAIIRLEELSPFPYEKLSETLKSFENVPITWVQEEPLNQGAWMYIQSHFRHISSTNLKYVGRPALPASAVGLHVKNTLQHETIFETIFPSR